jgi:hypothetical protein
MRWRPAASFRCCIGIADALRRCGRVEIRPSLSPRIALTERIDDATGQQNVAFTIDLPILGRVYEYAGCFRYQIRQGEGPAWASASS